MSSETEAGTRTWGVLGVPSSVAAHWPGIEQGPAALREAGLLGTLRAHGVRVADHGDLAVTRWTAERVDGRPNAWRQVVDVVAAARSAISEVVLADQAPLVLGGECTLAVALVAAVIERYGEVGLIYVDGGQDLMIPVDHPHEPILDAMVSPTCSTCPAAYLSSPASARDGRCCSPRTLPSSASATTRRTCTVWCQRPGCEARR
jgi:arginase